MNLAPYRKFLVALVGALALGLQQIFEIGDGATLFGLPADQLVDFIIAMTSAFFVYQVPNTPAPGEVRSPPTI